MNNLSKRKFIEKVDFFKNFSGDELNNICSLLEYKEFETGRPLCNYKIIPNEIYLIIEGEARLIYFEDNIPNTLGKIKSGEWAGLLSFLRISGCEEISAISQLKVFSIKDKDILNLIKDNNTFRNECLNKIWLAEIIELVKIRITESPSLNQNITIKQIAEKMLRNSRLVPVTQLVNNEKNKNEKFFIASSNFDRFDIGNSVLQDDLINETESVLPKRLIAWREDKFENICNNKKIKSKSEELPQNSNFKNPSEIPINTGLELGKTQENQLTLIKGIGELEEATACFKMLSKQLDFPYRRDAIESILRDHLKRGRKIDLQVCGNIALMMGLRVEGIRVNSSFGCRLQTPSLLMWKDSISIASKSNSNGLTIASPRHGWITISEEEIIKNYPKEIDLIILGKDDNLKSNNFGFQWFWPVIKKYKGVLIQVLFASFVVQLFSLANPLLIQVIIDKVINQRSLDTLQVLGSALLVVTILEGIIGSLRTFLFSETTNRIDMRLGSEVIDRLLRLPLKYFDRRNVGELSTRIGEMEKIRDFLTGQVLTTFLDATFSIIYIIIMVLYSWKLTIVALIVLPIQIILTIIGAPLFRRQYRESAIENSKTQSHLVEVINGIQTVKAQNVEMISRWKWQNLYSKYISRTFEKNITGTFLSETSQVLQKISQLLVLWFGASFVLAGKMTLGQLIAFRIISGYVTEPTLRLSRLWQSIQELRISFERLGDVVDTKEESDEIDKQKIPLPEIKGNVRFENISFNYQNSQRSILSNINLEVEKGSFVGVVGKSGCGKSTLMKLMTRLYKPSNGKILIDNYDIDKVELYSLRRQIGIVPQEPLLFSGTVLENISLINPEATNEEIIKAAKLACAHEFIMELPSGYSTNVGEKGGSLSGGQRQRIALARTLLTSPKMLILDEATSALDYETQRKICNNLISKKKDQSIFFITHRLSTIRKADLIILLSEGNIVEKGTHEELMKLGGRYSLLYQHQE